MSRWRVGEFPWLPPELVRGPRFRVVVDNDFAGDPDDLFQLAHHLLSPSVEIRAVVCSWLRRLTGGPSTGTVAQGLERLRELFEVMDADAGDVVVAGSDGPLTSRTQPIDSPGARAIVAEAMRDDVDTPLFVACGGGLTEIASAYLLEPRIADRLTLVWIGGPEHPGSAPPPPGALEPEYNVSIDPVAAQVVFNDSSLRIWQVPRDVYRQCLASDAELYERVARLGPFGRLLWDQLEAARQRFAARGVPLAETYAMGDSPLVLLTALQSMFEPDPSSSEYRLVPAPTFDADARMSPRPDGRPIRVYSRVDTRLMFEDMYVKFAAFARWRHDTGVA